MFNKRTPFIFATLILLTLSACQPQIDLEPASQPSYTATAPLATALLANPPLATRHSPTPPLATLPLATLPIKEQPMTEEPTSQPKQPSAEETTEPETNLDTTQPSPEENLQPATLNLVDQAKQDLAQRESLSAEEIELISYEDKVWSDSSLGCPQPGMMYLQVLKEGYLIRLRAAGQIYNYHGGEGRDPFLCKQPDPKIIITKNAPLDIKHPPTKSVPPPRD